MPDYTTYLLSLNRQSKVFLQLAADAILILLSFLAALYIRRESLELLTQPEVRTAVLLSSLATMAVLFLSGLYRVSIRYLTGRILLSIIKGAIASAIALVLASLVLGADIKNATAILNSVFIFLSLGGVRFMARQVFRDSNVSGRKPVIIYGAGETGLQVLNALFHGKEYQPVALVDDNERVQKLNVGGLPVFSPQQIPEIVGRTGAETILLAAPDMLRERKRQIVTETEHLQLEIKTVPGMSDLVSGKAKISELRTVSAEDLLGRDPVMPHPELLRRNISGKVVMVSGAGGSIGSELCRHILGQEPETLVLFEMSEFGLYSIGAELAEIACRMQYKTRIVPLLGSVQHPRRLRAAVRAFDVQTIYHAAAYKHVPLVEENIVEGIRNNVFGTLEIASAARDHGVENFILVSTDKAVRPTNIMGASKRLAELICQGLAQESARPVYSMVRFGNVLGSSGSVIPRFKEQIEKGGPVTVTHRDINRFFMTISEASQLVIQAGAMARGGDVFVLDMGDPVKVMDLAVSMVKLHGLTPYIVDHPDQVYPERGDIPICVTGLRKGEKLYEELLIGDNPLPTQHPRIMTASETSVPMSDLNPVLNRLLAACEGYDLPAIISIMRDLPLSYAPNGDSVSDLLWEAAQSGRNREISNPVPSTS